MRTHIAPLPLAALDEAINVALDALPRVADGFHRLLRIEPSVRASCPEWLKYELVRTGTMAAQDRWFVTDAALLSFYALDAAAGEPRLVYVDATPADVEAWRVSHITDTIAGRTPASFSRDPDNEYFLPREVADTRMVGPLIPVNKSAYADVYL